DACARSELNWDERLSIEEGGEEPWLAAAPDDREVYREGVRRILAALAEWADGALIDPKTWTRWDAEYEDIGPSLALVLSPRESEPERCPAGICRRPAGHAGPHSDLPREGER